MEPVAIKQIEQISTRLDLISAVYAQMCVRVCVCSKTLSNFSCYMHLPILLSFYLYWLEVMLSRHHRSAVDTVRRVYLTFYFQITDSVPLQFTNRRPVRLPIRRRIYVDQCHKSEMITIRNRLALVCIAVTKFR